MCHALFLASSKPLHLVSFRETVWFGVDEIDARHQGIRHHFPDGWFVYFLNSHEFCGCGFHSAEWPEADTEYDQESRKHLAAYLRSALSDPAVELALYDCWEGDELEPVESRGEANAEQIEQLADPVPERAFVRVRR